MVTSRTCVGKSNDFIARVQGDDSRLSAVQIRSTFFHALRDAGTARIEEFRGQKVPVAFLMGQGVHPNYGISILNRGLADLVFHLPSLALTLLFRGRDPQ